MKPLRIRLDASQQLLVEQFLKLTPSERLHYALGMSEFVLKINPKLKENRERLLNRRNQNKNSSSE
jgi:hypothetical protein